MKILTWELKRPQLTGRWRRTVHETIELGSDPKPSFYALVALSSVIAAFGLLLNSTAIVIGAMLIAPLMMPIFGIAMALAVGDTRMFRAAGISEIFGVILCIGLSCLIGWSSLDVGLGSEILARTKPTTYDILVAVAAGLAGAYSLLDERVNAALPGVAISTSLVPPLATCGLCLAHGRFDLALGGFLLFFANFLAIQLSSAAIFLYYGFSLEDKTMEEGSGVHALYSLPVFLRRFALSLVLLTAVGIFMTHTLYTSIQEQRFATHLKAALNTELKKRTGAQLAELHLKRGSDALQTVAIVYTPQEYLPREVKTIEQSLNTELNSKIHLIIRSIQSKDTDANGPVFLGGEELLKREQQNARERFLIHANTIIENALVRTPGAILRDIRIQELDGEKSILATIHTPEAVSPEQTKAIQDELQQNVEPGLRLIVRSVITRDADAVQYLYQAQEDKTQAPLEGEALALHQGIDTALRRHLMKVAPGSNLLEFRIQGQAEQLTILAVVRTPQNFTRSQVLKLQRSLRVEINPHLSLIVRSVVGVDIDQHGYVSAEDEVSQIY